MGLRVGGGLGRLKALKRRGSEDERIRDNLLRQTTPWTGKYEIPHAKSKSLFFSGSVEWVAAKKGNTED